MPRLRRLIQWFNAFGKPLFAKGSKSRRRTQRCYETLETRQLLAVVPLAPLAANDAFTTTEDQILAGNVIAGSLGGGADSSATPGLPMKIVELNGQAASIGTSLTLATGASLAISGDGSFSYDPSTSPSLSAIPAGQTEQDSFRYTLAPAFSQVVIFGDSLSDQGRLFAADNQQFPPDPPYFQGRMSNGQVWIEDLAPRLGLTVTLANNYAVAGATTGSANYNESILGTDLPGMTDELNQFLGELNGSPADPNALYVVWAGANDFFLPFDDPAVLIGQAVTNLATTVGTLHAFGAQHVLVMNLPDLGLTPYALASGQSTQLTALSFGFNATLEGAIAGLGFDVAMVDIFGSFQQIVADPAALGLTNVTTSCFNGATVVGNPADYLFWDAVHPTAAGHQLIAQTVFAALTDEGVVTINVGDDFTPPQLKVENYPGAGAGDLQLRLSTLDASPADQVGKLSYTVDWGDGGGLQTVEGLSQGIVVAHNYPLGTTPHVAVFVTDQDGDASQILHEAVVWGAVKNDQIEALLSGRDQFRIRISGRTITQFRSQDVDRLVVFGLGGNDWISAVNLPVAVELDGGSGNDLLVGSQRGDMLRGGAGNDVITGGSGDDLLEGQAGNDFLCGGLGNDTYQFGPGSLGIDTIHENAWEGTDTLDFSQFQMGIDLNLSQTLALHNPLLRLVLTNPNQFENVIGTVLNDTIIGNSASNSLRGGSGDYRLIGGDGVDYLYGEAGNDSLSGDAVDQLFGGLGQDRFDGVVENGASLLNPKPKKYRDWGVL